MTKVDWQAFLDCAGLTDWWLFARMEEIGSNRLARVLLRSNRRFPKMCIRIVQEGLPVHFRHRVLAGADEIPQLALDELALRGHARCSKTIRTQKLVNPIRRFQNLELAGGIGPCVFRCVREKH